MPRKKGTNVSNAKIMENSASFNPNKAHKKSATVTEKKPRVTKFYTDDIEKLLIDLTEMRDKMVAEMTDSYEVTEAPTPVSKPVSEPVSEPVSDPVSEPVSESVSEHEIVQIG